MLQLELVVQVMGTLLLALLAWTGNRMVRQLDSVMERVQEHGEYFASMNTRMEHFDRQLGEIREAVK